MSILQVPSLLPCSSSLIPPLPFSPYNSMTDLKQDVTMHLRLVDDAFIKTCDMVNDISVRVRALATKLLVRLVGLGRGSHQKVHQGLGRRATKSLLGSGEERPLKICQGLGRRGHQRFVRVWGGGEATKGSSGSTRGHQRFIRVRRGGVYKKSIGSVLCLFEWSLVFSRVTLVQ